MQEEKTLSFKHLIKADVWRCRGAYSARDLFSAWFQAPTIRPVVGGGCVVTKNVAHHTTVVGNPQRVIARRQTPKGYNPLPDHLR